MKSWSQRTFLSALLPALISSFALFASAFALFTPTHAYAQSSTRLRTGTGSGVVVNAESMFRDSVRQVIELKGNVQIIFDQQYMSCDRAVIDLAKQEILAEGNLVISSPQAYVEADSANLSYKDNTGTFVNGYVKSGPVIFEGKLVRKTGPQTYDAESASFTACTTCPTAWTFSGSRIQAEIGGYAYIKHAWLKVADFRTLWLPYLIVPLKSERQTGLLIPSFEATSSGGFGLGMNFFWAISRSQDATIGAKYYSKRGLKGLLNYRYMLNSASEGELNFGLIQDKVFGALPANNGLNENLSSHKNRFFTNYQHSYDLPDGFVQKMKLNYSSDLLYLRDFPEEMAGQGEPALENRVSLSRNTERTHASLDSAYYINQLKSDPVASNRDAVQRWPELRYSLTERALADSGLWSRTLFNFNFNYVNFARNDLAWDDVVVVGGVRTIDATRTQAGGGEFDPSVDVIRTGQRIDFQPEVSLPFRIGNAVDILPSVQFRHMQYELNAAGLPGSDFDASPYRQYLRTRLSARTRLSRIYGNRTPDAEPSRPSVTNWYDAESRGNEEIPQPVVPKSRPSLYRHEFEPEVAFSASPYFEQTENSVFLGSEDADTVPAFLDNQPISNSEFLAGRGFQFDYEDRIRNRTTASLILSNRLVRKSWSDAGLPIYKQIGSLKIAQSYDFEEARRKDVNPPDRKFPVSDVSALLDIRLDNFETNTLLRYFPVHNKTNTSSRVRVMDSAGRFLELNLIQTFAITKLVEESDRSRDETIGLASGFNQKYFGFAGAIDFRPTEWWPTELNTKSWSAIANIKPPGNCWGIIFSFTQIIGYELRTKLNFEYNFGGEASSATTAPPINTSRY